MDRTVQSYLAQAIWSSDVVESIINNEGVDINLASSLDPTTGKRQQRSQIVKVGSMNFVSYIKEETSDNDEDEDLSVKVSHPPLEEQHQVLSDPSGNNNDQFISRLNQLLQMRKLSLDEEDVRSSSGCSSSTLQRTQSTKEVRGEVMQKSVHLTGRTRTVSNIARSFRHKVANRAQSFKNLANK